MIFTILCQTQSSARDSGEVAPSGYWPHMKILCYTLLPGRDVGYFMKVQVFDNVVLYFFQETYYSLCFIFSNTFLDADFQGRCQGLLLVVSLLTKCL